MINITSLLCHTCISEANCRVEGGYSGVKDVYQVLRRLNSQAQNKKNPC